MMRGWWVVFLLVVVAVAVVGLWRSDLRVEHLVSSTVEIVQELPLAAVNRPEPAHDSNGRSEAGMESSEELPSVASEELPSEPLLQANASSEDQLVQ